MGVVQGTQLDPAELFPANSVLTLIPFLHNYRRINMRKLLSVFVLLAVVGSITLVSAGDEKEPQMPKDMTQYFVGIIYRGENWAPQVTEEVMQIQKEHLANIGRLVGTGEMVLAGPFDDNQDMRGLFFFDVTTMEEARKLVDTDPAVKAGRLRVELHPWWGPTALRGLVKNPTDKTADEK